MANLRESIECVVGVTLGVLAVTKDSVIHPGTVVHFVSVSVEQTSERKSAVVNFVIKVQSSIDLLQ